MRKLIILCYLTFGFAALAAAAGDEAEVRSTFYYPVVAFVDLETLDASAGFSKIEREMQYIISDFGDSSIDNHFCALGFRFRDGRVGATVFWEERGDLRRWLGNGNSPEDIEMNFGYADSLARSRGFLLEEAPFMDATGTVDEGLLPEFYFGAANGIGFHTLNNVLAEIAQCKQRGKLYTIAAFALGASIYAEGEIRTRAPVSALERHPDFASYDTEIRYLVARLGNPQTENHFCVVGYEMAWEGRGDIMHEAVVIWTEGHRLLRWDGGNGVMVYNRIGAGSLYESTTLDLESGQIVNENPNLPETAVGMRTRDRIEGTLTDCQKFGRHDIVPPFTPPEDFWLPREDDEEDEDIGQEAGNP